MKDSKLKIRNLIKIDKTVSIKVLKTLGFKVINRKIEYGGDKVTFIFAPEYLSN